MIKPEDLLTRLQNTIFSEDDKQKDDNNFDDNSGAFFNVTDLGQDSWIKTGWDPSTTNKPYPWEPGSMQGNVVEQDEKDEEKPKKEPVSPEPEVTPEEPKSQNVANGEYEGTAQDNMGMGNAGMGNAGMGMEEEEPKEPKELGRIYELKKIYTRLVSIESYLSTSSDETLIKLRNYVSRAIELFQLLISNIDSYTDKIDDIIVTFYKFLELVYNLLKQYYKNKENNEE